MSYMYPYPGDYRAEQVGAIISAVKAGECVSVVGLSGSGKSNLLVYLANHRHQDGPYFVMVDCNRLWDSSSQSLFQLIYCALGAPGEPEGSLGEMEVAITGSIERSPGGVCLLFDRFDMLAPEAPPTLYGNLRALRDLNKYKLTFVTATRRPLDPASELAELFYAHTLWLGRLGDGDARWSVMSYAQRARLSWNDEAVQALITLTSGYPSLLRATCEAYADGCSLQLNALAGHPAVQRRVAEFWADEPGERELRLSGMLGQPLLYFGRGQQGLIQKKEDTGLTAKEHLLLAYFETHPVIVCEKDDLIRAVWPEDRIFEQGIRDDSLAQLVRRLRTKIEIDPSKPRFIHTVPGRGYRYTP